MLFKADPFNKRNDQRWSSPYVLDLSREGDTWVLTKGTKGGPVKIRKLFFLATRITFMNIPGGVARVFLN
ncbi:MAG: hypothetical protein RLZZ69_658 [Cyanobacteriota bacterium]